GSRRWYLFLGGFTDVLKLREDLWTLPHFNGCVLHIAASAITEEQLGHIRAAMERGRTPEGVRAVVERGRRLAEAERVERQTHAAWQRNGFLQCGDGPGGHEPA